jgi:membrane-associated protein
VTPLLSSTAPMLLGISWLDPQKILTSVGTTATILIVLAIIFAECGVFPILPGDSLLFVMGLFIADNTLHIPVVLAIVLVCAAAWLGNVCGYLVGRRAGPALFTPGARIFKQEYADRTHVFFEQYGPGAVILARFVPIVRTVITWLAGVGRMDFRVYLVYSAVGAVLWGVVLTLAGYWLGQFAVIKDHIDVISVLIVALSLVPVALHRVRELRTRRTSES